MLCFINIFQEVGKQQLKYHVCKANDNTLILIKFITSVKVHFIRNYLINLKSFDGTLCLSGKQFGGGSINLKLEINDLLYNPLTELNL